MRTIKPAAQNVVELSEREEIEKIESPITYSETLITQASKGKGNLVQEIAFVGCFGYFKTCVRCRCRGVVFVVAIITMPTAVTSLHAQQPQCTTDTTYTMTTNSHNS